MDINKYSRSSMEDLSTEDKYYILEAVMHGFEVDYNLSKKKFDELEDLVYEIEYELREEKGVDI